MKKTKLYRNGEGYIDKKPGDAIRAAKREPENVIQFRRMLKAMGVIFHLKILGKVVLVDETVDRWVGGDLVKSRKNNCGYLYLVGSI